MVGLISKLDMYEILMEGVAKNDIILETGDIIFVPPYENFVEMTGEVKRPGIYELKKHETLEDAIGFSGGLKGSAYSKVIKISLELSQKGSSEIVNVNLEESRFKKFQNFTR